LHDAARRADVEAMAADLAASAFERIDANRTARLELLAVIGDAARPWIGVAEVRLALDEAAAERRGYARLATAALPLAGPEQAVVAAFERVDIVDGDPIAEVVDGNVDPDRALADHAFARRLIARAGSVVALGAGPLVVAP